MRPKRLNRQIVKAFGSDEFENNINNSLPYIQSLPPSKLRDFYFEVANNMSYFLDSVEASYVHLDDKANVAQRNLEVSSQELTVANKNLFHLNQTFDAMVNSLGQGFFLFGADGMCLNVYSKACETLLESVPSGRHFTDVLRVPDKEKGDIKDWCDLIFSGRFDFQEMSGFGPRKFKHSQGIAVGLEYKPVFNENKDLEFVVLIATDHTAEQVASEQARKMMALSTMVTKILKDKEGFRKLIRVSRDLIEKIKTLALSHNFDTQASTDAKRYLHTLKGAVSSYGLEDTKDSIHELETKIANYYDLESIQNEIRDGIEHVSKIYEDTLNEHREIFAEAMTDSEPTREVTVASLNKLHKLLSDLGPAAAQAQNHFIQSFLSVPLRKVFMQYNTVLQDTATKLNKKIAPIEFTGSDLTILPEKYEHLLSSLVHIFRNIADHGIERPTIRENRGKMAKGLVTVDFSSSENGNDLVIQIRDDGNGIDTQLIQEKLRSRELPSQGTHAELMNVIFMPGFTTASSVTDISGRGVGLDAVRNEIEKVGGKIKVDSVPEQWTSFTIRIPNALRQTHIG